MQVHCVGPTGYSMSYIRQAKLQPSSLEVSLNIIISSPSSSLSTVQVLASVSWSKAVLAVLSQHKHSFSDHVCLREEIFHNSL